MFTSLLLTAAYGKQYKKDGAENAQKAEIGRRKKNMFAGLLVLTAAVTYGIT